MEWTGYSVSFVLGLSIGLLALRTLVERRLRDREADLAASREQATRLDAENSHLKATLSGQLEQLEKQEHRLKEQFENLANRILEDNSSKLAARHEERLKLLLDPLRDNLHRFERQVSDAYDKENKERFALKGEVQRLMELNQQLSDDASNLTKALKGDSKKMGNWGQLMLERILERSGLREGEEYIRESKDLNLTNEEGRRLRPDIIVQLPENRHVIIDAKVSLTAYERSTACEDADEQQNHIKQHVASVTNHINELSAKHYDKLKGVQAPDFVFLFMPIEAAFSVALQEKDDLFQTAWEKNICLVSPTTLLAVLRTVEYLWKQEKQTRNALTIATEGGKLYDKFVGFVADLQNLGRNLEQTKNTFDAAMTKLSEGKGNLVKRAENLRTLGAKTAKRLPEALTDADL